MTAPSDRKPPDAPLRTMAEAELGHHPEERDAAPAAADLLHELQVHQVELEMQNEALRAAQAELEASRDRYVDLYDFAPVGYLTLSSDGMIEEINLTGATLLGYERRSLLHRRFTNCVVAADQGRWLQHFLGMKLQGRRDSIELSLHHGDHGMFPAQLDCGPLMTGADVTAIRIALTDISERRRTEAELAIYREHLEERVQVRTAELAEARDAAETANRAKSAFLANMSHELRTPLNGIMGMTALALKHATDTKQIDQLQKSQVAANHLLSLINDVLDITRIEAGRMTLAEEAFSVTPLVDEVLQLMAPAARDKGLDLGREIDASLPGLLHGDPLRLKQILINFVGNAIKFSSHGTITVRARLEAAETGSCEVLLRIEVSDQGIGLSPGQCARLFRAFTQVDDSMTRRHGGSGLGLAISKRLAQLMGGDAGVDSEEGVGSTFWATARLRRATDGPA